MKASYATKMGGGTSKTRRRAWQGRRFIRDARPATPWYNSGTFWYSIWRNIRR